MTLLFSLKKSRTPRIRYSSWLSDIPSVHKERKFSLLQMRDGSELAGREKMGAAGVYITKTATAALLNLSCWTFPATPLLFRIANTKEVSFSGMLVFQSVLAQDSIHLSVFAHKPKIYLLLAQESVIQVLNEGHVTSKIKVYNIRKSVK